MRGTGGAGSTYCPLCRIDLRPIFSSGADDDADDERMPSPRQLGFTRDGGTIMRYDPNPHEDCPRPSYIPEELRSVASIVEIQYPDHGVARVWRVPRTREGGE